MKAEKICGVVLAGGKSLRMGRDKALLEVHGQSLIARAVGELSLLTDEILISANDPDRYRSLGLPVIPDVYPRQGPLAGLHATMDRTQRPLLLLFACDLPRVGARLLARLVELAPGFDAVIPRSSDGIVHPLCAVYRRTTFRHIENALVRQLNKMTGFLDDPSLKVRWIGPEEGGYVDEDLINLKSPKDLENYFTSARPVQP